MKKDELIELLQRQNDFLQGKLEEALTSVRSLTSANEKLTATVEELRRQIAFLEETLKGKDIELSKKNITTSNSVRKKLPVRQCAACRNPRRKGRPDR